MRALTSTIVAAGRTSRNTSPWTARTSADRLMSVTSIRVRTTSESPKPASARAPSMMASAARAWPEMSPGCSDRPSAPASVVPATQHELPTTIARL